MDKCSPKKSYQNSLDFDFDMKASEISTMLVIMEAFPLLTILSDWVPEDQVYACKLTRGRTRLLKTFGSSRGTYICTKVRLGKVDDFPEII